MEDTVEVSHLLGWWPSEGSMGILSSPGEDFSPWWDSVVESEVARETVCCFYINSSMSPAKAQVTDEFADLLLSILFSFLLPLGWSPQSF